MIYRHKTEPIVIQIISKISTEVGWTDAIVLYDATHYYTSPNERVCLPNDTLKDLYVEVSWKDVVKGQKCSHELIPIKNIIIDSGFMCVHCKKVFREYTGPPLQIIGGELCGASISGTVKGEEASI